MILFRSVLIAFILACCFACKKDAPVDNSLGCIKEYLKISFSFEDTTYNCCDCPVDWQEIISLDIPFDYFYPAFNPSNNDQLAYYRRVNSSGWSPGYEIWVADFCDNTKIKIADNAYYGLSWSKGDWIFYTALDQNIYKIKPNGDSLTQITLQGDYNRYPKISPSGNKMLYQTEEDGITNLLVLDFNSGIIDTIKTTPATGAWNWIDENRIFYILLKADDTFDLIVFNTSTKQEKILHELSIYESSGSPVITAVPLLKENSILWCTYNAVGKTNLNTGDYSILLSTFSQELFLDISLASDGLSFLLSKRTMHQIDNCHVDSDFEFYFISDNGTDQQRLLL